jgi:predicted amidohydrolase
VFNHIAKNYLSLLRGIVLRLGIWQFETNSLESIEKRFDKFQSLLPPKNSCDLLVLPELWLQGAFEYSTFLTSTLNNLDSYLMQISKLAKKNNYWIHSGSFLVKERDKIFNQAYLFDNVGRIRAKYKKNYVFGFGSGESKVVSAANELKVINTPWGYLSFAICYDLRFPELFRKMVLESTEILLISAAWPLQRIDDWKNLVIARAIENQLLVIACNGVGIQTDATLGGNSLIVAANGERILEFGNYEMFRIYEVDTNFTSHQRESFPVLKDIKKDFNL